MFAGAVVDVDAVKYVPKSGDSAPRVGANSDDPRGEEDLGGVTAGENPRLS
jgi:hypothetical protein